MIRIRASAARPRVMASRISLTPIRLAAGFPNPNHRGTSGTSRYASHNPVAA
jgi:hypothetical protein